MSAGPPCALSAEDVLSPQASRRMAEGRQGGEPAAPAEGASTCSAWTWPAHRRARTQDSPPPSLTGSSFYAPSRWGKSRTILQVPVGAIAPYFLDPLSFVGFFAGSPWSQGLDKGQHFGGSEFSVSVSLSLSFSVSPPPPPPLGLRTRILHIQEVVWCPNP